MLGNITSLVPFMKIYKAIMSVQYKLVLLIAAMFSQGRLKKGIFVLQLEVPFPKLYRWKYIYTI